MLRQAPDWLASPAFNPVRPVIWVKQQRSASRTLGSACELSTQAKVERSRDLPSPCRPLHGRQPQRLLQQKRLPDPLPPGKLQGEGSQGGTKARKVTGTGLTPSVRRRRCPGRRDSRHKGGPGAAGSRGDTRRGLPVQTWRGSAARRRRPPPPRRARRGPGLTGGRPARQRLGSADGLTDARWTAAAGAGTAAAGAGRAAEALPRPRYVTMRPGRRRRSPGPPTGARGRGQPRGGRARSRRGGTRGAPPGTGARPHRPGCRSRRAPRVPAPAPPTPPGRAPLLRPPDGDPPRPAHAPPAPPPHPPAAVREPALPSPPFARSPLLPLRLPS
ncbi:translation initiation factor IF-2-like [Acinonyx jubatus]|uniref:Translation initiation factor IF-2-like n=1 Tax=Acinonyx jubatus TaxID=32536 RepID=A0ABM3PXV3_ACIJB|nr:translation initiation factor IF-2-like [Acinonyx jubatus]